MPTRPVPVEPGDPQEIARSLAAAFENEHGRAPDGVYAAPGRVNLIGEHLDYNGGRVLPIALPHACYVASGRRTDDIVTVRSLQAEDTWEGRPDDVAPGAQSGYPGYSGYTAYVAGVLWALREDGFEVPGLDLLVDGRVPLGAGRADDRRRLRRLGDRAGADRPGRAGRARGRGRVRRAQLGQAGRARGARLRPGEPTALTCAGVRWR